MDSQGHATVAERWHHYWLRPIPPHIYAVLRMVFGILCIFDLLGATPVSMFWDLDGITPVPGGGVWGFRAWVADSGFAPLAARVFFAGSFLAYLCMALGISQAAVIASFAASICQGFWNVLPLSSAHQALIAVLFSLVWVDCCQVLTLTRARGARETVRPQLIGPLRVLQYQVCLIYLYSGVTKFTGPLWRDGSALYYALSHNVVQRFPVDVLPASLLGLATVATYGTLVYELAFPGLVAWRRTRAWALLGGVALHLGAWLTVEVGPFSWVMIATYIAFISPERVANLVTGGYFRASERAILR